MAKKYTKLVDENDLISKYSVEPFRILVNSRCDRYIDTINRSISCDIQPDDWKKEYKHYHMSDCSTLSYPQNEYEYRIENYDISDYEEFTILAPKIICHTIGFDVRIEKRYDILFYISKHKETKEITIRNDCQCRNLGMANLSSGKNIAAAIGGFKKEISEFTGYAEERVDEFLKMLERDWTEVHNYDLSTLFLFAEKGSFFEKWENIKDYYNFLSYFRGSINSTKNYFAACSKEEFFREGFRIPKKMINVMKNFKSFMTDRYYSAYYIRSISDNNYLRLENYPEELQNIIIYYCNGIIDSGQLKVFLDKYLPEDFYNNNIVEAFRRFIIRIFPITNKIEDFKVICNNLVKEGIEIKPENMSIRLLSALQNKDNYEDTYQMVEMLLENNDYLKVFDVVAGVAE